MLCGGSSLRMGRPKSHLRIRSKSLLENTLDTLQGAGCQPLAVAASSRHPLPDLGIHKSNIILSFDNNEGQGPLAGLEAGLSSLHPHTPWACVVPCDLPCLHPKALVHLLQKAWEEGGPAVTILRQGDRINPLIGVFPTAWHQRASSLIASGRFRADSLLDGVPDLRCLQVSATDPVWRDCDTPDDFTALERLVEPPSNPGGKPV